jgi:hypothetical protein
MSKRHRKPTASTKKVAKIAFTAAGSQRADHARSSGRSAGARADCPLSAMPVKAQYIVRAGMLAVALGVGGAVATTPGVAFAEPCDTSSSGSSSTSSSSSESAASTSSTEPTSSTRSSSSTNSSASAAGSSSGSTSGVVQSSVDAQASSTSSPRHASMADPRSGIKKSSGGAHTSPTLSSSDTTASAGATRTQTGVPSAVATAAPAEPPAAALSTRQPTAASPSEQPASPVPSAEPVASPVVREAATPETPVATAAVPPPDAPHRNSRAAPNSAGSDPTNRSGGSASSTSANPQSTVVVKAAATPASTAQPRTATQAAVESVASTSSAVKGALETQAVPKAFSAPSKPPNVVSGVVSNALADVGLSPVVSNNPLAPVDSPAELAALAWARRQMRVEETPILSKTAAQSSQTVDDVMSDVTALSAPVTMNVAAAAVVAPPPSIPGARLFTGGYSTGDFSQWSSVQNRRYNGNGVRYVPTYSATVVNDPVKGKAARFEVRAGDYPGFPSGERSQVGSNSSQTGGTEGQTRWYEFSTRFDPTFPKNHADLGWGVTNGWHPNSSTGSSPFQWAVGQRNGYWSLTTQKQSSPGVYLSTSTIFEVPLGTAWHDVKMQVHFSTSDAKGWIRLWHNGVRQTFSNGADTYYVRTLVPGTTTVYYKEGYYRQAMKPTGIVYTTGVRVTDG